jgi:hypothetical protein
MILCYPTETLADYELVKQWFVDHKELANGTVVKIQCTLPGVLPGTKLEKTIDLDAFENTELSRYKHAIDTVNVMRQCGFNVQTFF